MISNNIFPISISFLNAPGDAHDDNVDVVVMLSNGERRTVTFFTLNNIKRLMTQFEQSGECLGGLYFWAKEMVVVRDLKEETIHEVVNGMVSSGEYQHVYGISQ